MKKNTSRKIFAATASAALVATAVVPAAFAATSFTDISNLPANEQAAITALVEAGILDGKREGIFAPHAEMKRAEVAKVISLVAELDVDNATAAGFNDVEGHWAKKYINAAAAAGILNGKGENKFDPEASMKRAEFAKIVVEAFDLELIEGVENTFEDVDGHWGQENIEILFSHGLINGKSAIKFGPEELMKRSHVALLTNNAMEYEVPPISGDPEVASVSAINATQVEVKFTQPVDESTLLTFGGFVPGTVTMTPLAGTNPGAATGSLGGALSADGKTLTINTGNPLSGRYDVVIDNVKSKEGEDVAKYEEMITIVADTTAPTVLGTERISSNKVKVNFSEPVTGGTITAKYADGTTITGLGALSVTNSDELILDLSATTVEVGKDIVVTFNGVMDMANNLITPQPTTVTVKKEAADGIAPEVENITQTGSKTFNIKFSKDLDGFVFTADGTEVDYTGGAVTAIDKVSASEYKVTVNANLEGVQTVTVKNGKAIDFDGQMNAADIDKVLTFHKDTVAPEATSKLAVNGIGEEVIELTFDKDVSAGNVTLTGNYMKDFISTTLSTLTPTAIHPDANNKKVVHIPLADGGSAVTNLAVEGAVYDLKINSSAIQSDTLVDMKEATVKYTRGEDTQTNPVTTDVVTSIAVQTQTDNDKVEIEFTLPNGQKLDGASATDLANYTVPNAEIKSISLSASDNASPALQTVTLTLKEDSSTFTGPRNITVKNVKVANSTKVMDPKVDTQTLNENIRPTIGNAKVSGGDEITLTFTENVTVNNKDAFEVKADGVVIATTATGAVGTAVKDVKITMDAALTQGQLGKTITVEPTKLANTNNVDTTKFDIVDVPAGNKLKAFDPITVTIP